METENKKLNSYLTFKLENETFAANVSKVLNILELTKITKVPKAPNYMKGVINLRGSVLPLIDTRVKFGMTDTEFTTNTCILVLDIEMENESVHIGALVDSVQEVIELKDDDITAPPSIGNKYKSEFIDGMARYKEEFVMILNMDYIFSVDDIINMQEMTTIAKENTDVEEKIKE